MLVVLRSVEELRTQLESYQAPLEFRRARESLFIWRPLYEKMLEALHETVEDDWPFQHYPGDWKTRTGALLKQIEEALGDEVVCHYPQRWDSDFGTLRGALEKACADPLSLDGRLVGRCRALWKQSVAELGALGSREREDELARRKLGFETDAETWGKQYARTLGAKNPEMGLDRDFCLDEIPSVFRELFLESVETELQEHLETGRVKSLSQLLEVGVKFASDGESGLSTLVKLWWQYFPHEVLEKKDRDNMNRLLGEARISWRLPCQRSEVKSEFLQTSLSFSEGTLFGSYFSQGFESLGSHCHHLLNEQEDSVRVWSLLDNVLCGGAFALASELGPPDNPGKSATLCLEFCLDCTQHKETKPYRRLRQQKKLATGWQQALFFLSFCSEVEVESILSAYQEGELGLLVEDLLAFHSGAERTVEALRGWV